jgi:hypothetical protein
MRTSQQRHCSPPGSGPELLARTQTGLGAPSIDTLPDLYAQWERWAIDVSYSHSAYLPLVRFRSSERWTSRKENPQASGVLRSRDQHFVYQHPPGFPAKNRAPGARLALGDAAQYTAKCPGAAAGAGAVTATLTAASKKQAAATDVLTGTGGVGGPAPGHLYWAAGDSIWEANLDGSSSQAIVTGQHNPEGVAVNASHLYWTDSGDGTIWEANLDGTNPQAVVTGQLLPYGMAVGGPKTGLMYWTNRGDGTVHFAALDGTDGFAIVGGQHHPQGMVVSSAGDAHLYWANNGDGTIWEADWPDGTNPHAIVTGQQLPAGVAVGPQ